MENWFHKLIDHTVSGGSVLAKLKYNQIPIKSVAIFTGQRANDKLWANKKLEKHIPNMIHDNILATNIWEISIQTEIKQVKGNLSDIIIKDNHSKKIFIL